MNDPRILHTVPISATDISKIAAVEQRCFQAPWSPTACAAELSAGGGYVTIGGPPETIAGYLFYRIVLDEMHIMKVATDHPWRNRRIASRLLEKTVALAGEKGLRQVCLEVRASNLAAVNLYVKHGFIQSGRRPGYYDNREDAILMVRKLDGKRPVRPRPQ
ncbi:MAG: ribosomal protein S18-alanine N-acetyltransferase [Thermodesulfobacteriota bacterium]